jgi:hypothetical protein
MKNIIILVVVAALVAGTALYALLFHKPVETNTTEEEQVTDVVEESQTEEQEESFSGAGPLSSLLSYGKNLECVINYIPNEYEQVVTGTYFVSGTSVRGDFLINSEDLGGQVLSSIILNDGTFYSWSTINNMSYGMKADIAAMSTGAGSETIKQPVPQDARVEYTCDTWNPVDGSVFVPPSSVKFQDYSALLETGMEYSTIYKEE